MANLVDLTIPSNRFTIDSVPTEVRPRQFDGNDNPLPKIVFRDLETQNISYERSASIATFAFNGTTLLTPSAVNHKYDLGVQDVKYDQLEGRLLVLDFEHGKQYGAKKITELFQSKRILDIEGKKVNDNKYVVLFRTGLMDKVLETVDERGVPDYDKLDETQKDRPGFLNDGAKLLAELDIASAYLIDNISFEIQRDQTGFASTQQLMKANPKNRTFTPLVYHIGKTNSAEFKSLTSSGEVYARIELGNIPDVPLAGHPVAVRLYKK